MSRKKSSPKKDQEKKPDTGAVLAAKSSSVSFPVTPVPKAVPGKDPKNPSA